MRGRLQDTPSKMLFGVVGKDLEARDLNRIPPGTEKDAVPDQMGLGPAAPRQ